MPCVYLLTVPGVRAFKVGWATEASSRAAVVAPGHDTARSYQLVGLCQCRAQALEGALHRLLVPYRVQGVGVPGNGATEWYDNSVWDEVRALIEGAAHLMGYSAIEPVPRWEPGAIRGRAAI